MTTTTTTTKLLQRRKLFSLPSRFGWFVWVCFPPLSCWLVFYFSSVSFFFLCQQHKSYHVSLDQVIGYAPKFIVETYANLQLLCAKRQWNGTWLFLFFFFSVVKDQATKEKTLQNMSSMSSAQIVSASSLHNNKTGLSGLGLPAPVSYPPPVVIHIIIPFMCFCDLFSQTLSYRGGPNIDFLMTPFLFLCFVFSFWPNIFVIAVLAAWSPTWTLSRVRFVIHSVALAIVCSFCAVCFLFYFSVSSRSHNHITQLAPVLLRITNQQRRMVGQVHPPPGAAGRLKWPASWRLHRQHPTTTHLRLHRRPQWRRWPRRPVSPLQLHPRHGKDGPSPPTSCGWSSSRPSSSSNAIPIRYVRCRNAIFSTDTPKQRISNISFGSDCHFSSFLSSPRRNFCVFYLDSISAWMHFLNFLSHFFFLNSTTNICLCKLEAPPVTRTPC